VQCTFRNSFSGQGVVETVSCIRIQRRDSSDNVEAESSEPTCSKRLKLDSSNVHASKGTLTEDNTASLDDSTVEPTEKCTVEHCACKDFNSELQCGNSTKLERENISLERRNALRCESRGIQTDFDNDDDRGNNDDDDDDEDEDEVQDEGDVEPESEEEAEELEEIEREDQEENQEEESHEEEQERRRRRRRRRRDQ